jgi:hypothetical protein
MLLESLPLKTIALTEKTLIDCQHEELTELIQAKEGLDPVTASQRALSTLLRDATAKLYEKIHRYKNK